MGSLPRQGFVTVHALESGWFTMPERFFVTPLEDAGVKKTVPSLSFLVQHHDQLTSVTTRVIFDLGIRKDLTKYSEAIQSHVATRFPLSSVPDPTCALTAGGLTPNDIDIVILSHLHWDHVGTPADFPRSTFVVGSGALELLTKNQASGTHNHFEPDLLPLDRTIELHSPSNATTNHFPSSCISEEWSTCLLNRIWESKGPFQHALDVFGDGSLYAVHAPGHLTGHVNLLCRKEEGSYVYLAGDAAHDMRLLSGEKSIATWQDEDNKNCCIHQDPVTTDKTLSIIRQAWKGTTELGQVEVVLAHDNEWAIRSKASGRFFPGKL